VRAGSLELTWLGERRDELRARFAFRGGQPLVRELAARRNGGTWIVLGQNLSPEFEITSGVRRLSQQQMSPLQEMKVELTPEGQAAIVEVPAVLAEVMNAHLAGFSKTEWLALKTYLKRMVETGEAMRDAG